MFIAAAHQHAAGVFVAILADIRRDIADREADTWLVRGVDLRSVDDSDVMERHFAGLEHDVHSLRFVHLNRDFLSARECIFGVVGFVLGKRGTLMRARNHAHAAILSGAARKRDPGGGNVGRMESPIGCVLMPGNVGLSRQGVWKTSVPQQRPVPAHGPLAFGAIKVNFVRVVHFRSPFKKSSSRQYSGTATMMPTTIIQVGSG